MGNIYEDFHIPEKGEIFQTLERVKNVKIERIISSDKIPVNEYNQKQDEWVLILKGEATLNINGEIKYMKEGDFIFIPAYTPHRVLEVKKGTVWLAVHIF